MGRGAVGCMQVLALLCTVLGVAPSGGKVLCIAGPGMARQHCVCR